jgi:hypothetical protein
MALGFESFIVAVIFLLPGFIASYIRLSRTPATPARQSALQETLAGLATSSLVFLLELALILLLRVLFAPIQLDIDLILRSGLRAYALIHPVRLVGVVVIWGILSLSLSLVMGFVHPIEWIAARNRRKITRVAYGPDIWYDIFEAAPQRHGVARSYVRAWLRSGACYAGWLESFEVPDQDKEYRYFWLIDVRRWHTYTEVERGDPGERMQAVLLNSEDIQSMDAWWADRNA